MEKYSVCCDYCKKILADNDEVVTGDPVSVNWDYMHKECFNEHCFEMVEGTLIWK